MIDLQTAYEENKIRRERNEKLVPEDNQCLHECEGGICFNSFDTLYDFLSDREDPKTFKILMSQFMSSMFFCNGEWHGYYQCPSCSL